MPSLEFGFPSIDDTDHGTRTVLVAKEHHTKCLHASAVPTKGHEVDWGAESFLQFIDELGYKHVPIALKSDGEPAIQALLSRIASCREAPTRIEPTPTGDSQSNGHAENAVRKIEAKMRALK